MWENIKNMEVLALSYDVLVFKDMPVLKCINMKKFGVGTVYYLDENKMVILAIVDKRSKGKVDKCAR